MVSERKKIWIRTDLFTNKPPSPGQSAIDAPTFRARRIILLGIGTSAHSGAD